MRAVRDKAMFCVGRAVLFASLAIALIMLSFAFDPPVALKAGGVLGLVLSAVLIWYAQTAHRRAPKDTETWLLLEARFRPQGDQAERAFAAVMEEVYLFFATRAFAAAVGLLLAGLGFTLVAGVMSPL